LQKVKQTESFQQKIEVFQDYSSIQSKKNVEEVMVAKFTIFNDDEK